MKTLNTLLATFILTSFFLGGCSTNDVQVKEKSKAKILEDSLMQAKNDSIKQAEVERQAYLKRPWKVNDFVDNFGDKTGGRYIMTSTTGLFSNSATSNAELWIELLLSKNTVGLFLHEYSPSRAAAKFIGGGKMMLKNEAEEKIEIYVTGDWNQQGGVKFDGNNYSKLISFFKKSSGKIKAVVLDEYSSTYNFTIDLTGFKEEYSLLDKK